MSLIEKELWKPVPGYPDYEVSNFGRVRSLDRVCVHEQQDRWSAVILTVARKRRGQMLRPGTVKSGHQIVLLGRKNEFFVHTLVLEAFVGPAPDRMECCHNDGNPANNRLENLRWDTRSSNVLDDYLHGVRKRGPKESASCTR
jgi:hypothetical protein